MTENFFPTIRIFRKQYWGVDCDAKFRMEIDIEDDEANVKKFRDYAAECRRMAGAASEKDRVVLIEIAQAWMVCAEQAERTAKHRRKN